MSLNSRLYEISIVVRTTFSDFLNDNAPRTAAALTYQTLFALVPLLTVSYRLLSAFTAFDGIESQIEDFIFSNFVPETGTVVQTYLRDFSLQARELTTAGVMVLAVTAFIMLMTIERAFNEIWQINVPRRGLSRFLLYWAVLTLGPFCLAMALTASTYIATLPLVTDVQQSGMLIQIVPLAMTTVLFSLLYIAVPNCRVSVVHGCLGGLIVALLFEIAESAFILVVAQSSYQVVYGAFATVPLFLMWVYLAWNLILFGAVLVRNMGRNLTRGEAEEPKYMTLLRILYEFDKAHHAGKALDDNGLVQAIAGIRLDDWYQYRALLIDMNLISHNHQGDLLLSKNLEDVTLWQIYENIPWQLPTRGSLTSEDIWQKEIGNRLERIAELTRQDLNITISDLFRQA